MDPVIASCERGWPIQEECSRAIGISIYLFSIVLTLITTLLPLPYSYRAIGHLPLSFFVACTVKILLICLSVAYIFFLFYLRNYSHMILVLYVTKLTFWVLSLTSLIRSRNLSYLPFCLAFSYSMISVYQLIPLFAWTSYFDEESHKNGVLAFFFVESGSLTVLFFVTMCSSTIRSDRSSTWSGFSRKLSLILPFVWPKKSFSLQVRVAFCLFLLVFGRIINVALPLYSKWIVNELNDPDTFHFSLIYVATFLKFLQGNGAMGGFLNTLRSYLWIPIQQYTTRELEVELFSHLHSLSLRWHLSRKTGLVLRVMDRGTNSVNSILNYVLFNIVPTIADIIIAVAVFFSTFNIYFGSLVFVTMFLYLLVTITVTEWRTKFRREMNEKENATSAIGTDSLLNYETVKYYGNEDYEVDRFRRAINEFQTAEWKSSASLAFLNCTQNAIIGMGLLLGSVLVAYFITVDKSLSVGDYIFFTTYILQLYAPLNFFGTVYRTIQKSFIDMENMFDLMNEEVEVKDSPSAVEYKTSSGTISVQNISFAYNETNPVLTGISFNVSSGQSIALVGPSGSGKSTMIRLLFRLFETTDGSICFDEKDVKDLKLKSLRSAIGIVPQDTVLFNDTIMYNIRFGNPSASDEEVFSAAKAAMIHDKIISLPQGYNTMVGERGLKLSGGEKQRVAIARTILKKPQYIFLDEATSALDTNTERAIQKCLDDLCSTRTSVVVAHRLSTVVNATCILVLDKGKIVEEGSHNVLMDKKGIYYHMWESQSHQGNNSSENLLNQSE